MIPQKKHPSSWYTAFSLTWLCKFIGTKESVYIRKEFNSHRTCLVHQHGRRFTVLEHQYGHRDVMRKLSITYTTCREAAWPTDESFGAFIQVSSTTFFCRICWKEQILPRNLSNLGTASLFPYPLFSLLRSSSARMKIEIAGIYWLQANIGNFSWY